MRALRPPAAGVRWASRACPPAAGVGGMARREGVYRLIDTNVFADPRAGPRAPGKGGAFGCILADRAWEFVNRTGNMPPEHKWRSRCGIMDVATIGARPMAGISAATSHRIPLGFQCAPAGRLAQVQVGVARDPSGWRQRRVRRWLLCPQRVIWLHSDGAVSLDIIVTLGSSLHACMRQLVDRFVRERGISSFEELPGRRFEPTRAHPVPRLDAGAAALH